MSKLFKHLKPYWMTVAGIIVILFVQAFCDLSLPSYTSDIVNVGIQQGGVEDTVPEALPEEEMNRLCLFLGEEDQETVKAAYTLEQETDEYNYDGAVYVMNSTGEEQKEELLDILGRPMMLVYGFESGSSMTDQVEESLKSQMGEGAGNLDDMDIFQILAMLPEEQRAAMTGQIAEMTEDMPEMITEQSATAWVRQVYEELGMDMESIQNGYILRTGGKMLALAFLGMLASVLAGLLSSLTAAGVGRDLRGKVFQKVVGFSNTEFDRFSTASLITRSTNDIQQIQMMTVLLLRMVLYAPVMAVGGLYRVFHTNVDMLWIIGLGVVLIVIVVIFLFAVVMPRFRLLQKLVDRLNLVTREILTGLSVIRAFSREKYEENRFDKANRDLTKTNLFVNRAMTFMMPVMMLVMNGITVLIVWNGAHGIDNGQMQVGDMMAFIQYTMQIIMAFLMICMVSVMLPRAAVAAGRVDEVLESRTSIEDAKEPVSMLAEKKGEVVFDHVSFRYPQAEEDVLSDISFTAKPGETTAIIGSTGSGKSTLVNLIPRFYDVTGGRITVGGKDIREISQHELRDRLGYVPQKGVLFSGTIASNILYGCPEGEEEQMKEAARIAQAEEFIEEKPEGYESPVSQGGGNVSGGQKQRLSIARAVAKQPDIFIFDDSFSALDYKTDVALRTALHEKTKDSTVIIVAQRISTVLHADQIIMLDGGKIAGKGTHKELLRTCPEYYQVAASQLSAEELEGDMKEPARTEGKEGADHE
ncbi:ABC transporter ATP-binding protein [Candidatus Bariatricus faecipullorum]